MSTATGEDREDDGERIHKVLAGLGYGSRREVERWIDDGRVRVNGQAASLGQRVTAADRLEIDGQRVHLGGRVAPEVLVLNKPAGIVCTRRDPEGRRTVFEGLPKLKQGRWIGVGRLDVATTGLFLATTDGALAHRLMHPSTGLDREYAVRVDQVLEDDQLEQLKQGLTVEGEFLRFSDVQFYDGTDNNAWYHVVLLEGRNREIRRLFGAVGCRVSRLKRVRYGPVILPSWLRVGQFALMQGDDVKQLYRITRLPFPNVGRRRPRRGNLAKASVLIPYPELEVSSHAHETVGHGGERRGRR